MTIQLEVKKPTAEEIAQHYDAAMCSVNLIVQNLRPDYTSDEEWEDCVERNKEHIRIMLAKDFWTTEDLTPLYAAVGLENQQA